MSRIFNFIGRKFGESFKKVLTSKIEISRPFMKVSINEMSNLLKTYTH